MSHYFTNDDVPSKLERKLVNIGDKTFNFFTDNGVFSKKGLDFGSRTLIDTLLTCNIKGDVLDVGCGYGVIGIVISSFFDAKIDMVDVNKRAIHLAKMNIKENGVKNIAAFESFCYQNINKKYDIIITNPPIRAGKKVVYEILFDAKQHLKENGVLYFVMNKDQGAKSTMKDLSEIASVEVLTKNKGFFVIKCIFN